MNIEINRRKFLKLSVLAGAGAALFVDACTKKTQQFYNGSELAAKLREGEQGANETTAPSMEPLKIATATDVPTKAPSADTPALTETSEPAKPTEFYEILYQRVMQIREERRKADPDYEKRVDWELNKDRINFLVLGMDLGMDTREVKLGEDLARADAIVCLSLDIKGNIVKAISIPRDLHSPRTDVLASKSDLCDCAGLYFRINATTVFGTAEDMLPIMEDITGLSQDICVVFNFEGAKKIIDSIGGVEINITQTFFDLYNGDFLSEREWDSRIMELKPGRMVLNGTTAFWYARVREKDDCWARDSRQREVAMATLKKGREIVSNEPGKFLSLAYSLFGLIQKKELELVGKFNWDDILGLAWDLRDKPQILRALEVPPMESLNIWDGLVASGRLPDQERYQIFMNDQSTDDPPNTQEAYLDYWHEVRNRVNSLLTSKE